MSLFSVNTNLGAMAALQSLNQTQNALTSTQNQISSGLAVGSAADNPAIYAITQAMNWQISGLAAVQSNLSFGAQVVGTASSSAASISSTLNALQNTLTLGQTQGLSQTQMNNSITAAMQQVDTFANAATFNGVNLLAGATGNGVTGTQLQVLTGASGSSFTVGGNGAQALNATSTGLGLSGLSVTSNDVQIALGSDSAATATSGMVLNAAGAVAGGAIGSQTVNTNVVLQTSNFGTTNGTQTSQNPGSQTVVMLTDGSTNGTKDVMNELNYLVNAATVANGGVAATVGTADSSAGNGTNFTLNNNGNISLTAGQKGGSITDLGNGTSQYTMAIASDANGNPTQTVSVIAANVGTANGVTNPNVTVASGTTLTAALLGTTGNTAANMATRQQALATMVSAMNSAGLSASIDTNNNLTISGNNINTTGSATPNSYNAASVSVNEIGLSSSSGVNLSVTGTGGKAAANTISATGSLYGVQQSNATAAISNITAAITKLGTISSKLGTSSNEITGMQSFTSTLSSALTAGVGALTDADMATESAKLTSLQTKQQLGIQALSIANQQPQALLKLFG